MGAYGTDDPFGFRGVVVSRWSRSRLAASRILTVMRLAADARFAKVIGPWSLIAHFNASATIFSRFSIPAL